MLQVTVPWMIIQPPVKQASINMPVISKVSSLWICINEITNAHEIFPSKQHAHDTCTCIYIHVLATHLGAWWGQSSNNNYAILFYSSGYVPAENGTFDTLLNLGGITY